MARARYTFYVKGARAKELEQIEAIFLDAASNEQAYSEIWFRILNGGNGDIISDLLAAARKEHREWADMYSHFYKVAKAEEFDDVSDLFKGAKIEKTHE